MQQGKEPLLASKQCLQLVLQAFKQNIQGKEPLLASKQCSQLVLQAFKQNIQAFNINERQACHKKNMP